MLNQLINLYKESFGSAPRDVSLLKAAGSNRQYYRLFSESDNKPSIIGVIGTSAEENKSFYTLAKLFAEQQLNVPAVYAISDDAACYLQEDLGDLSLFDYIRKGRENGGNYNEDERMAVESVIRELPALQMKMYSPDVFKHCYPMESMDKQSIMFDLNYFKYCFLKLKGLEFNEVRLQEDFERLSSHLLDVSEYGFQYRDFQARNVMMKSGHNYYIDFQGGRRGPVYYDLASFLWQASSQFLDTFREQMIEVYLQELQSFIKVDKEVFKRKLLLFVFFRILQVLGAYGYRGLWEKKQHFIESIPLALKNLNGLKDKGICDDYPYLKQIVVELTSDNQPLNKASGNLAQQLLEQDKSYYKKAEKPLVVRVFSFSYKKGIPQDESGNGGGYVFDCRSTHNPGRYDQYKQINGLQQPVIKFLEEDGEILGFLESVYKLADFHVKRFIDRGFTNLMFAFGCTGGQHRSVYSAQHLAEHINQKFGVEVRICHREQNVTQILQAK